MKLVGIGETVLDIIFRNGQPVAAVPGGSTFNSMISLGRTAAKLAAKADASGSAKDTDAEDKAKPEVIMLSQVGSDKVAEIVTTFMERNGVSSSGMRKIKGTQSVVSMAMLDENNDASYEFFRDSRTPEFEAPEIKFEQQDALLFGSYFAVGQPTRMGTRKVVKAAREAGATVYYDINYRANHLQDIDELRPIAEQNCALSTIVRGSSEDLMNMYGNSDAEAIYNEHIAKLCPTFIVTHGGEKTEIFGPNIHKVYPVPPIKTVSTIGAGDNFNAGVIYALAKSGWLASKGELDWDRIIQTATSFSANVCQSLFNYVSENFQPVE